LCKNETIVLVFAKEGKTTIRDRDQAKERTVFRIGEFRE